MTAALWVLTRAALLAAVWLWDGDDDITELAWTWAREVLAGQSPYHEVAVSYPPLAMFGFALPGLVAPGPDDYALPFALLVLVVDAVGARWGGLRYVLAVPAVGPVLLLWRYDLAPAVCHLGAAVLALQGRRAGSWGLLGLGIALKPYLLVVVPLWLLWDRSLPRASLALLPSLVAAGAMTALIGFEWLDAYVFQGRREVSVEAGPAVVASLFGLGSVELDQACLCFVRTGIDPAGTIGSLVGFAALAGIYWRSRRVEAEGLVNASVCCVAAILLVAPVLSPQYLVWLLPIAALLGGPALWLAAAAAFTAFLAYPVLYDDVLDGDALPLLLLRLVLLATLIAVAISPRGGEKLPAQP